MKKWVVVGFPYSRQLSVKKRIANLREAGYEIKKATGNNLGMYWIRRKK